MSGYIRLANAFDLYRLNGGNEVEKGQYQNARPGQTLAFNGGSYDYLSFIYQGAAKNRTGDNLEAALNMSVNELSVGWAQKAVKMRFHIRIWTLLLNPNEQVNRRLTEENWIASSMTYDAQTLEVILSSSIDAVGTTAPTRVLTRDMVGHLPVTANIQTQ